jgi:L,D-transpeptidase-like protein/putative peptidoglycan binding protein
MKRRPIRRRLTRRRWPWISLAALVALLTVGVGALYAYDMTRADVIAKGVSVSGVDVGGLQRDEAVARLRRELVPQLERPVVATFGGRRFVLGPVRARLQVDVDGMVDAAVNVSRTGNFISRVYRDVRGRRVDAALSAEVRYSPRAVTAFADRIRKRVSSKPRDARVEPSALALRVVPSKNGVAVPVRRLRRAVVSELVNPDAPHAFEVPARVLRPRVTTAKLAKKYPVYLTICRSCFELRLWVGLKLRKVYRIAVGQQGLETPAGSYTIDDKQVNPSWHVPNSPWAGALAGKVIPPGPDDPIKARWMGFYNGAGIHGTDAVYSLGTAASHGCIRMSIPDVIELYDQVPWGTPIYVG